MVKISIIVISSVFGMLLTSFVWYIYQKKRGTWKGRTGHFHTLFSFISCPAVLFPYLLFLLWNSQVVSVFSFEVLIFGDLALLRTKILYIKENISPIFLFILLLSNDLPCNR